MKLSHSRPKIVNREAELRRPTAVGSSALLGITVVIMAIALLVNVLHVVDLELEARGEKSMRQMIWQVLKLKSTKPTKPKDAVSPTPDVSGSFEPPKHTSYENYQRASLAKTHL